MLKFRLFFAFYQLFFPTFLPYFMGGRFTSPLKASKISKLDIKDDSNLPPSQIENHEIPSTPEAKQFPISANIHDGIHCDNCGTVPIRGIRYKVTITTNLLIYV